MIHHLCESIFVTRHKNQSQQVFPLEIGACVLFSGYTADMHTRQLGSSSSARLEDSTTLSIHDDPLYSFRSLIFCSSTEAYLPVHNTRIRPCIGFATNHCCRKTSPFPSYNTIQPRNGMIGLSPSMYLPAHPHHETHYETHVYVILIHRSFSYTPAFSPSQATHSRNRLAAIPVFLICI
jgi:hypothetical protein